MDSGLIPGLVCFPVAVIKKHSEQTQLGEERFSFIFHIPGHKPLPKESQGRNMKEITWKQGRKQRPGGMQLTGLLRLTSASVLLTQPRHTPDSKDPQWASHS